MVIRIGPNPPSFTPPERGDKAARLKPTTRTNDSDSDGAGSLRGAARQSFDPGPAVRVDISDQGRALAAQLARTESNPSQAAKQLPSP